MKEIERVALSPADIEEHERKREIRELVETSRIRARLPAVGSIGEILRKTARLPVSDREIMARNLGLTLQSYVDANQPIPDRQVFLSAFGEVVGESKLKKRKDFILKPGESPRLDANGAPRLAASGRDFADLAMAIARFSPHATSDAEDMAILKVIYGTSLDNTKLQVESSNIEAIKKASRALMSGIDPSELFQFGEMLSRLSPSLSDKLTDQLCNPGTENSSPWAAYSQTLSQLSKAIEIEADWYGRSGSILAPSVPLGELYIKADGDVLSVNWPYTGDGYTEGLLEAFADGFAMMPNCLYEDKDALRLADRYRQARTDEEMADLDDEFSTMCNEHFPSIEDEALKDQSALSQCGHVAVYFRTFVDLQLRFHRDLERWIPCLAIQPPDSDASGALDHAFFEAVHPTQSGAFTGVTLWPNDCLFCCSSGVGGKMAYLADIKLPHAYAYDIQDDHRPRLLYGFDCGDDFEAGCFALDGKLANKILNAPFTEKVKFRGALRNEKNMGTTPLPANTLGGLLLNNLAFEKKEESIPILLAQDFAEKFAVVQGLFADSLSEFEHGMSRWD